MHRSTPQNEDLLRQQADTFLQGPTARVGPFLFVRARACSDLVRIPGKSEQLHLPFFENGKDSDAPIGTGHDVDRTAQFF
jgi:hypothetical protein